jgi:superfamily I DNA/RNA helicase
MNFRIADTFTASLARLTGEEQKAVKQSAFDLQMNPAQPGMSLHRLDQCRDKHFWSARAGSDIRIILHRTDGSLMLCYVDHHDKAYAWAERRKLETHPQTGAAQLVEIRETVKEILVPVYKEAEQPAIPKPPLFANRSDSELLGYGVPPEWLDDVKCADEDQLLLLADHLPAEAAEALLELATGGTPRRPEAAQPDDNPFEHPDAQRRFRVMSNVEELEKALEYPWEKWTVFLHPEQRQWVEHKYNGPARVSGSAGTGKTIVALHRAAWLAREHPESRVLMTTFSDILANALRIKLHRLIWNEPRLAERIDVYAMPALALRLHKSILSPVNLVSEVEMDQIIRHAADAVPDQSFSHAFLLSEWTQVVDAWQLRTWDEYRDVARLGRKTRLPENKRKILWDIFDAVRSELDKRNRMTEAMVFEALAAAYQKTSSPYEYVVVDESQDISVAQLRFLAAMAKAHPDALFFAGDLGQRIFQIPFSWKSLGVDIRGRSRTLRVNYRTSHQIRKQADRLLGPEVADIDGNVEHRTDTISVFNGEPPIIRIFPSEDEESNGIAAWVQEHIDQGLLPHEIGIFVRAEDQIERAKRALDKADVSGHVLDTKMNAPQGAVCMGTMHVAKGLEFRAVAVMACDDEILPLQGRIEQIGDDADLQEVYDTERHLLYVACTRARDHLLISAVEPASEFLDDLAVSV